MDHTVAAEDVRDVRDLSESGNEDYIPLAVTNPSQTSGGDGADNKR